MALDPFNPLTPEQIAAAENLFATGILEYHPELQYTPPPAIASPTTLLPPQGASNLDLAPVSVKTAVNLIATYRDIQALQAWHTSALSALENKLSSVTAPVVGNAALSQSEIVTLKAYLNSEIVTFSNLTSALADPVGVNLLIIQAWSRTMWDPGGRFDGLAYINLYRTATSYLPLISTQAQNLLALMAYSYVGTPNGQSPETYITALSSNINNLPVSGAASDAASASYAQVQNAITASTSETFDQSLAIATATQSQANSQGAVSEFVTNISTGNCTSAGPGYNLSGIIAALRGLVFLLTLVSSGSWASFAGIEARIFNLITSLVMGLVGEAANAFAQITATVLAPVQKAFLNFTSCYGGNIPADINQFGDTAVQVMEYVISRFEKFALDWYRSNWLHLNLSGQSTQSSTRNAGIQNLITILNYLIEILVEVQAVENHQVTINWGAIGNKVAGSYAQNIAPQTVLTSPAPLVNPTPPQNANINSLGSPASASNWGLQMAGTPSQILANLA